MGMTLGIVAYLVFVVHSTVVPLYWGQAAVFALEMCICLAIWYGSDWKRYAAETQARQEAKSSPSPQALRSPMLLLGSPASQREYMELDPSSPEMSLMGLPSGSCDRAEGE